MLINLNLMRNNELVKFLNYQILKKTPQLLAYIKHKLNLARKSEHAETDSQSEFQAIEKAITVL